MTPHPVIIALERHAGYWRGRALTRKQFADQTEHLPGEEWLDHHRAAAEYDRKAAECAKWRAG